MTARRALLVLAALLVACLRGANGVTSFAISGANLSAFPSGSANVTYAGAAAFYNLRPDACGVCGGDNSTCAGCDGVPNSGKVLDGCGTCTRNCTPGDPGCAFQLICPDCAGVVNGTKDTNGACGGCRDPDDPLYGTPGVPNYALGGCVGCDGVPNSGKIKDACGACLLPTDAAFNASCAGCDGVPNSGLVYDACCVCNGSATYASPCYQELLAAQGGAAAAPFDPNTQSYGSFYSALGRARYDACGECRGWGYGGAECAGCDGVPMSGALPDPCGVCNGTCACAAGATNAAGACGGGAGTACALVQVSGPGADGTPLYPSAPQNRPGLPAWVAAAGAACAPPGTPPPATTAEWVVLLYGRELGPFTLTQLRTGVVDVFDQVTQAAVAVALTPSTLVGRVLTTVVSRNITYGYTSALPARAAAWAAAARGRPGVQSAPSGTGVENVVTLLVNATSARNFSDPATGEATLRFAAVGAVPELLGVAYPSCSGVSYRNGAQRTHGKKTALNAMGLIVSNNISDTFSGLANQTWNPWAEFIFDVANQWEDQTCVCSEEWTFTPEAVPPTCAREWGTFDRWQADTHAQPPYAGAPFALRAERSAAVATLRLGGGPSGGGGFGILDGGGISVGSYGAAGAQLAGVYGSDATRGPWRVTAQGTLSFVSLGPLPNVAPQCAPSARLVPPLPGAAGALWFVSGPLPVTGGFSTTFSFMLSAPAQRCKDVRQLSRSYSEEVRTRSYTSCTTLAGDGLALVLLDAATAPTSTTVGAGGGALGYGGLRNSLAIEFDTLGDPSLQEPALPHVAVLSRGALPNSASHEYRLGATAEVPPFADGAVHTARVTFTGQMDLGALVAALDTPSWRGGGDNMAAMLASGASPGLLQVYLDNMTAPLLTVPFAASSFLRAGSNSSYFGLTASTGAVWQAVDVLSWNASGAA